jgi:hypothetical protein
MKVVVGLGLQIMCSYITFPLYALVTQVDLTMKISVKWSWREAYERQSNYVHVLACRWART